MEKISGQNKNVKNKICTAYRQARFIYLKIHIKKYSKQGKVISNYITRKIM